MAKEFDEKAIKEEQEAAANSEKEDTTKKEPASENSNEESTEKNQESKKDSKEEELSAEEKLSIELTEAKDKYLRLYSEFENFRRRNAKERLELVKNASEEIITELLPVIDDFERAEDATDESLKEGLSLIKNKFYKVLSSKGLEPMKAEVGMDFDPELHEAITKIPAPEEKLKGKVVDTIEKGYYLNDKVIRFAKVVIGE